MHISFTMVFALYFSLLTFESEILFKSSMRKVDSGYNFYLIRLVYRCYLVKHDRSKLRFSPNNYIIIFLNMYFVELVLAT